MTQYEVFGPYEVPIELTKKKAKQIIERKTSSEEEANGVFGLSSWWGRDERASLRSCTGCYIFAMRAGKGYKPWYVGKTSKQTLEDEAFTDRNIKMMSNLANNVKGTLVLFLVSTGRVKTNDKHVDEIETWLIKQAQAANSELMNAKKTKDPDWTINGLMGDGRKSQSDSAAALARTLNLKIRKKKA